MHRSAIRRALVAIVPFILLACSSERGDPAHGDGSGASGQAGSGGPAGSTGGGALDGSGGAAGDALGTEAGGTAGTSTGGASGTGGSGGAGAPGTGGGASSDGAAGSGELAEVSVVRVTTWKHDAKAAYSIIHDDVCDSTTSGIFPNRKELTSRKLRAGFGMIVSECEASEYLILKELMAAGHEMIDHSYTHPHIPNQGTNVTHELVDSTNELVAKLGVPIKFFIFPYDESNDALLGKLQEIGYLGARGGERGVADADVDTRNPYADFRISFEAYEGGGVGALDKYVDDAISSGGWANRELHGIDDGSWGKVALTAYTAHLDHVVALVAARKLWMDTPTTLLKYRRSRAHCGAPVATSGAIKFPPADANCQKYATPLSIVVTSSDAGIVARQGGAEVPVESLGGGQFIVDVDPAGGATSVFRQ
jgi:hypothetical protein